MWAVIVICLGLGRCDVFGKKYVGPSALGIKMGEARCDACAYMYAQGLLRPPGTTIPQ